MKMKKVFALAALILTFHGVLAMAQSKKGGSAEEAVRKLSDEEVQGLLKSDSAALSRLWSDDMVVTNPLNKFVTKQDVLGMTKSGALAFTAYQRNIEYVKVYGQTVIVAGNETVTWAGTLPIAGKTNQLRFTAIWMKRGGRWQEVARHANIIPAH